MNKIFFSLLICVSSFSNAQINYFQKNYLSQTNNNNGTCIAHTHDNGMIVLGASEVANNGYVFLLRLDQNGDTLWTRIFKWTGSNFFLNYNSVQQTADNGFVFTGTSGDIMEVIKTNANGDSLWTHYWDPHTSSFKYDCLLETEDHGFMITGTITQSVTGMDVFVMKLDSAGNTLWQYAYSFPGAQNVFDIKKSGNEYVIAGYTVETQYDFMLMKIDVTGNFVWAHRYSGLGTDYGGSVDVAPGGYISTGYAVVNINTDVRGINFFTDLNGNVIWSKSYQNNNMLQTTCIKATPDGGFITSGSSQTTGSDPRAILFKTDGTGNVLWATKFNDTINSSLNYVDIGLDGSYLVTGFRDIIASQTYGINIIKCDSSNAITCDDVSITIQTTNVTLADTLMTFNKDTLITTPYPDSPVVLKGFSETVQCSYNGIDENNNEKFFMVYPNPANNEISLKFKSSLSAEINLFDSQGRKIYSGRISNTDSFIFNLEDANSGLYLLQIKSGLIQYSKRIIIQR